MRFLLRIYDFFVSRKPVCWGGMLLCVALCLVAALRLDYKEDITDFLPLDARQKQSMDYYRRISQAERIVILFEGEDTDTLLDAVDRFAALAGERDIVIANHLTTQIDMQLYMDVLRWVYANMPYFLDEQDYARMDSVLAQPDAVALGVDNCRRVMQMPVSGFMHLAVTCDPLSLFAPVVGSLRDFQPVSDRFTSMDGYMLSQDGRMAFAFCRSPYGDGETGRNTGLVRGLETLCEDVMNDFPGTDVRLLGAPVIAVENASCIRRDSLLSVGLALILILAVLGYCFRRDLRAIPLIVLTIAFGWLFAMAVMGLTTGNVSVIVLGMGSIIIGIAVNYPLHILFHQRYTSSTRQTLREVAAPLVTGNITTVGAFVALIPLDAAALRELGIFAASMLVGTILFSILFLPQLMRPAGLMQQETDRQEASRPAVKPSLRYAAIAGIALLTAVFWHIGRDLSFDADVSHINYMTPQQRDDVAYFTSLAGETGMADVYIVEPQAEATNPNSFSCDTAIQTVYSPWRWLPSEEEQQRRIARWNAFWETRREPVLRQLNEAASRQGFNPKAFAPFADLLKAEWSPRSFDYFRPVAENMLSGYWMEDTARVSLVTRVSVPKDRLASAENRLRGIASADSNVFDIHSLNASLAEQLSGSFDYIGLVCSLLVFFFLWLSFRSFRAAVVAFLPMAVSWVWIMGIMHLLGLQFNIVNVILATFIFGQGDDYTVFVVEGLQYEHATGKRMLPQFRRSIILSAVIMFAGIGVLVIARHPAMFSLGAVTLTGMAVVVLMANIIPPLLKQFLFKFTKTE